MPAVAFVGYADSAYREKLTAILNFATSMPVLYHFY